MKRINMNIAGHSKRLFCDSVNSSCGLVHNGISFSFDTEGGWVMPFEKLEKVYLLALAERRKYAKGVE